MEVDDAVAEAALAVWVEIDPEAIRQRLLAGADDERRQQQMDLVDQPRRSVPPR